MSLRFPRINARKRLARKEVEARQLRQRRARLSLRVESLEERTLFAGLGGLEKPYLDSGDDANSRTGEVFNSTKWTIESGTTIVGTISGATDMADVNGDGKIQVLVRNPSRGNNTLTAISTNDGTIVFKYSIDPNTRGGTVVAYESAGDRSGWVNTNAGPISGASTSSGGYMIVDPNNPDAGDGDNGDDDNGGGDNDGGDNGGGDNGGGDNGGGGTGGGVLEPSTITADHAALTGPEGSSLVNTGYYGLVPGRTNPTVTASVGSVTINSLDNTWQWYLDAADGPAGPKVVTVTLDDGSGVKVNTTFTYSIDNIAPTISLSGSSTIPEGSSYALYLGTVTDPGTDSISQYTIDWGDGTVESFVGHPTGNTHGHVYPDGPNDQTYKVTVQDEDGTFLAGQFSVAVLNVAPTADLSVKPITFGETATASLANVQDPSATDTKAGLHFAFALSDDFTNVTYAVGSQTDASQDFPSLAAGTYTVYARVIDKDEGFTTYSTQLVVAQATTTTTLNSSLDFPVVNVDALTLTATVGPANGQTETPTGVVTFFAGDVVLGTATLVDGVATLPVSSSTLVGGTHELKAVYGGNDNYLASDDGLTQEVDGRFLAEVTTRDVVIDLKQVVTNGGTIDFQDGVADVITISHVGKDQLLVDIDGSVVVKLSVDDADSLTILGTQDDDTFVVRGDSLLTGVDVRFDGGDGQDTLDLSDAGGAVSIVLSGFGTIDGYQGSIDGSDATFNNVDGVVGTGTTDTLQAADQETVWDLGGVNGNQLTGAVQFDDCDGGTDAAYGTLGFRGFANLVGGSKQDTFMIAPGFELTGTLDGGGNPATAGDTLDYRSWTTSLQVDLAAATASAIRGGLIGGRGADVGSSIENVFGGGGDDVLRGDSHANQLAGFGGNDTLNGRGGVDTVDGGMGSDTIEVAGDEATYDALIAGPVVSVDVDLLKNVGNGVVVLREFPTIAIGGGDAFDVYDGNGFALRGDADANRLDFGSLVTVNMPALEAGDGNDRVVVAYGSSSDSSGSIYDGGAGTADEVTISISAEALMTLTSAEFTSIAGYVSNPVDATLDLRGNNSLNMLVTGFEAASLAIVVDGVASRIPAEALFGDLGGRNLIIGTEGDDVLTGTEGYDIIIGLGGNDVIRGLQGPDIVLGGAGNDVIYGGTGVNYFYGGQGDDVIYGGDGTDWLYGGLGNDSLYGEGGGDWLEGGSGNDQLFGGENIDMLIGGAGDDGLYGEAGEDTLNGGLGDDRIDGGADNDDLQTQGAEAIYDVMIGGNGFNRLTNVGPNGMPLVLHNFSGLSGPNASQIHYLFANSAEIHGTSEADSFDFSGMNLYNVVAIQGMDGNDWIRGSVMADTIYGNAGNDVIYGGESNDSLFGGGGDDVLYGEGGADYLASCVGNDTLYGGADNDTLLGQGGQDTLFGEAGSDSLNGGVGIDAIYGGSDDDSIRTKGTESIDDLIDGGDGVNRLDNLASGTPLVFSSFVGAKSRISFLYAYNSEIHGTDAVNVFDFSATSLYNVPAIAGFGGNDTITGTQAADVIFGGDGDDLITGLGGNDTLVGDDGNDSLYGGVGADSIFGRGGNDWLYGDADIDALFGEDGDDSLFGGDAGDVLNGGAGADFADGGLGFDNFEVKGDEAANDRIADSSGTGDRITNTGGATPVVFRNFDGPTSGIEFFYANGAEVVGTDEANVLDFRMTKTTYITLYNVAAIRGFAGDDVIFGGRAMNVIYGGDGNDTIYGADLNDTLHGDAGHDVIYGLAGADTIVGGLGSDTVYGGAGTDNFRFDRSASDATDNDVIGDWNADFIQLYGYQATDFSTEFVAGTLSINPTAKKITLLGVTTRPSSSYIRVFA